MIIIKSKHEIDIMREAAKVTGEILRNLKDFIKPGMSTMKIDDYIENFITKRGMKPAFKGLYGFPGSACISVNEEIVHGQRKVSSQGWNFVKWDSDCRTYLMPYRLEQRQAD